MYRSVFSSLIGTICSPHLQSVSVKLVCLSGEVEHFPWGVVNSLTKVSPHMLQKVEIALQLQVETDSDWDITSQLSTGEYESYFCEVRSALPDLDQKLIMSIAVRYLSQIFVNLTSLCSTRSKQDISDALVCDVMGCNNKGTINAVPVMLSSSFNRARLRHPQRPRLLAPGFLLSRVTLRG